jgi:hypothetical protein
MIETLISSKTRIKLLMKFFLNSNTVSYLRGLESEFGESSNAIRVELNRLEQANMLRSYTEGNKKYFQANSQHPLFGEIHNILRKHIGIDAIIENIVDRLGDVQEVYLHGDFAEGRDSAIIDLILIGKIDTAYFIQLIAKTERLINRKIRYLIYSAEEAKSGLSDHTDPSPLLLWKKE